MAVYRDAPKCPDCGHEIKPINNDMGDNFVGDTFVRWDWEGHDCPANRKGKYVSRSTYQKLAEENKKLLKDIRILTEEGFPSAAKIITLDKWRRKFKEERDMFNLLRDLFKRPES